METFSGTGDCSLDGVLQAREALARRVGAPPWYWPLVGVRVT